MHYKQAIKSINLKKIVNPPSGGESQPLDEFPWCHPQGHQALEHSPQWGQHRQDH